MIIIPSSWCNFRCIYCYENDHFRIRNILTTPEIIKRIKLFLENNIKTVFSRKSISDGMEESLLLDFKTIKDIMDFANLMAKTYKIDIVGEIITNGYLLDITKFKILLEKM
ncbi:radical SAM protein [Sulfolobus sp. S-194]|uniref:radical SAM protein n=1 Tax=Sulfolobus sp. S-194 TaxID=2512240 RepID=UPI00336A9AAD